MDRTMISPLDRVSPPVGEFRAISTLNRPDALVCTLKYTVLEWDGARTTFRVSALGEGELCTGQGYGPRTCRNAGSDRDWQPALLGG